MINVRRLWRTADPSARTEVLGRDDKTYRAMKRVAMRDNLCLGTRGKPCLPLLSYLLRSIAKLNHSEFDPL